LERRDLLHLNSLEALQPLEALLHSLLQLYALQLYVLHLVQVLELANEQSA